ncbi:hypothetical protein A2W45_04095 [Candidatus Curtissbacteria bacterium RIFCSPHIGHO2_12_41_11]|uniref:Uncharacterized protein n=2 Tax=Candidatus Curtissiibacteriota TaxID=1752717 RepID=A0A1F5H5U5_9BACT|nr:MAG: hypothetical protein A3D07_03905 [Candidatus Curtissbacteria bacterium RIFCSPHIGHO2_02_FULL_42_15]OGD99425.1 MAG: hypothetical protein A2W45_04095 [Candidatus Curtissbacteria bacterium RIFCSPHIGHO2_12_41_11]
MKKLKNILNDNKIIVVIIVLVIAWFYWFQLRPASIRSSCMKISRENTALLGTTDSFEQLEWSKKIEVQNETMEKAYQRCLHDKGLK